MTVAQINLLLEQKWEKKDFTKTTTGGGELPKNEKKIISAMIIPEKLNEDSNFKHIKANIPQVGRITEAILIDKGTIRIDKEERVNIPGLSMEEGEGEYKSVYVLQAALMSSEAVETIDVMNWCQALVNIAKTEQSTQLEMLLPKGSNPHHTRIIVECCLYGTDVTARLRWKDTPAPVNQPRNETALMHVAPGASFADVVKEMKGSTSTSTWGINIKKVEETDKGHVKLTFEETTKGGKRRLNEEMTNSLKTVKDVSVFDRSKGIMIYNLEPGTEINDVIESLARELHTDKEEIKVLPFRQPRRGKVSTSAFLPYGAAREAIRRRRISITGQYERARIEERFDTPFCRKCWKPGHSYRECSVDEEVPRPCLNCGKQDHPSSGCQLEEACYTCNLQKGHRANSMRCPEYRRLINDIRSRNGKH